MRWIHVLGFTRRAGDKAACVAGSVVALSCIKRISLCWSSWEACCFERGLLGVVWLVTGTRSPAVDQEQKRGWSWHGGPSRAIRASAEDGTAVEMYATGSNESKRTIAKGQAGDDASTIDTGSRQGPQIGTTVGPEGGGRKSISASSSRATRPSALSEMPHAENTFTCVGLWYTPTRICANFSRVFSKLKHENMYSLHMTPVGSQFSRTRPSPPQTPQNHNIRRLVMLVVHSVPSAQSFIRRSTGNSQ